MVLYIYIEGTLHLVVTSDMEKFKGFSPSGPGSGRKEKLTLSFFIFTLLCGASEVYEGLKALHKTF